MYLEQFFLEGLGHGSYMVGDESAGVAAVIDPRRDVDVYLTSAQRMGLAIKHVLETHTHNDYVSGARELTSLTGAQLWASGAGGGAGLEYEFHALREGDTVEVGNVTLRAWETAGHTPEHLAFLAFEGAAGDDASAVAVFTGGSLMVGSAGRTDLSGAEQTQALARAQYENLRRFFALPDGVNVYPTHGGGSFCGGASGGSRQSTIGHERRSNALAGYIERQDPAGFAHALLDQLPVVPGYWPRMRPLNRRGARPLGELGVAGLSGILAPHALSPEDVRRLIECDEVYVMDARDPAGFGGAHIRGAFGVGIGASFGVWAGSVVPADRPLVLVLPEGEGGAGCALAKA